MKGFTALSATGLVCLVVIHAAQATFPGAGLRCRCTKFCRKFEIPFGSCGWNRVSCCKAKSFGLGTPGAGFLGGAMFGFRAGGLKGSKWFGGKLGAFGGWGAKSLKGGFGLHKGSDHGAPAAGHGAHGHGHGGKSEMSFGHGHGMPKYSKKSAMMDSHGHGHGHGHGGHAPSPKHGHGFPEFHGHSDPHAHGPPHKPSGHGHGHGHGFPKKSYSTGHGHGPSHGHGHEVFPTYSKKVAMHPPPSFGHHGEFSGKHGPSYMPSKFSGKSVMHAPSMHHAPVEHHGSKGPVHAPAFPASKFTSAPMPSMFGGKYAMFGPGFFTGGFGAAVPAVPSVAAPAPHAEPMFHGPPPKEAMYAPSFVDMGFGGMEATGYAPSAYGGAYGDKGYHYGGVADPYGGAMVAGFGGGFVAH